MVPPQTHAPTVPDHGESSESPARGATIGRFVVLEALGAGGMGVVVAAYDPDLDRKVALKLLRPGLWHGDASPRDRLVREAQAMARLAHPNVVTVYEIGVAGAQSYIVMELVDGRTLRRALADERPSPRAALRWLRAAGEGLAAAHRAGLVHRDFKPDNVLVGADGRARVTDFGLAAAIAGDARSDTPGTGPVAGTPGYMAPEQQRGAPTDARTDQFAFCVTAYEALYGELPFPATATGEEVGDVKLPSSPDVPKPAAVAIQRGLAADPEHRWPSMDALLAQLERDPRATRRRVAAAAAALGTIATAAFVVGRSNTPAAAPPCEGGTAEIADVWNEEARTRVREAFVKISPAYGLDTFHRVDRALYGRQAGWAAAHRDACEDTRVRGEQSEALLDRRMQCLARARAGMTAVVDAFGRADPGTVERATKMALDAGDHEACADASALSALVPRPSDPAKASLIADVERQVAALDAADRAGRYAEGLAADDAAIAAAREAGWPPLLADALARSAMLENGGGALDAAEARLYEALEAAQAGHADVTAARVLRDLVYVVGYQRARIPEAEVLIRLATGALARAGSPPLLEAELARAAGAVLQAKGEHVDALARYRRALELLERARGPEHPELVAALIDLADAMRELNQIREARPHYERAVAVAEISLGPTHPTTAASLNNLGVALRELGELAKASEVTERSLEIRRRVHGPDHARVATVEHNLGIIRAEQGRLEDARTLYEHALAVRTDLLGPNHPLVPTTIAALASLATQQKRYDEAVQLHLRALAIKLEINGPNHPSVAYSCQALGNVYRLLDRRTEARAQYENALRIRTKVVGPDAADTAEPLIGLAQLDLAEGDPARARRGLERSLKNIENTLGASHGSLIEPQLLLAEVLLAVGEVDAAAALVERAATLVPGHTRPSHADGVVRFMRAKVLWARATPAARDRARALVGEARGLIANVPDAVELPAIDRWIAEHR